MTQIMDAVSTQPNVVYIQHQPTFTVSVLPACKVCNQPVTGYHEGPCGHLMHQTCETGACRLCQPLLEDKLVASAVWAMGGFMGLSDLMLRQYYMAVLHSLCPGYFFLYRLILIGLRDVVLSRLYRTHSEMDEYVFLFSCYLAFPPEFAVVAMWVTGFYYMPINELYRGPYPRLVEAAVSMGCMAMALMALHENEAVGVTLVSATAAYRMWKWPTIWDIHLGNCFGFLSMAMFVGGSLCVGVFVHQTFHTVAYVQIHILSQVFFSQRSMRHYFKAQDATIIAFLSVAWTVSIMVNKLNVYEARLRSQKN